MSPIPSLSTWNPLGHLAAFRADPIGLFTRAHANGDPIVALRLGPETALSINTHTAVQRVLVDNARNYEKRTTGYAVLRRLLGEGLVTAEGETWRRKRRIANPAFHKRCMAGFADTMNDDAARWVAALSTSAPGTYVDIHRELVRLTLGIAGQTLFHVDLRDESDIVTPSVAQAMSAFRNLVASTFPHVEWLPTQANRDMVQAVQKLDGVVQSIIERRRADAEQLPDLLGMLMSTVDDDTGNALSDAELRDEVVTMLLAGHETTANALSWCMYLLAQHPEICAALTQEIQAAVPEGPFSLDLLAKLPLLQATLRESLRLYPPIWLFARRSIEPDTLDGIEIPGKTIVFFSPWLLQRHPEYWPEPLAFRPERFLQTPAGRAPPAYLPFSLGARKCIGDRFAEAEMGIILGHFLRRFAPVAKPNHDPGIFASVTMSPANGVYVHLEPVSTGEQAVL